MKEYKPLIFFLVKFFITYFVLTIGYDFYLKDTQVIDLVNSQSDPYTIEVTKQASTIYNIIFDSTSSIIQNKENPYMDFLINKVRVAHVNEGCNSISIMIIMISFIIAFKAKWRITLPYLLGSLLFVHVVNIIRISILANILYSQSSYAKLAHDVFFPGIIYGSIILICIVWIRFFVFKKDEDE